EMSAKPDAPVACDFLIGGKKGGKKIKSQKNLPPTKAKKTERCRRYSREGDGKTADGTLRSCAHLLGQIDYARGDHVKIFRFSLVRHANGTIAVLVGSINESC